MSTDLTDAERVLLDLVQESHTELEGRKVPTWTVRYDAFRKAREYLDAKRIEWSAKRP